MKPPAIILLLASILMFILALLPLDKTIDFQVGATIYILSPHLIFFSLAAVLLVAWILYKKTSAGILSISFSWIYLMFTIISLIAILYLYFTPVDASDYVQIPKHIQWGTISWFVFLLCQIIFLLYILVRLLKGKGK
jgi:hypothetical protein